ncbi:hypothetical protein ZOD2009_17488 [Haladaptatus paucihalophilus DX253]|uniref:Zinc ribbon domain-containing protein n=1 Tax=Haladaptatus paucihalophilus DX253 TaxID=797209 RepID=E7QXF9_HALPU|nr:hypothetical protein [Haladaptatus paucihalophilus]EFW90962.1 hypothetical protein ZOD2009_17488 [Haladaptatus paucihalophilus DX253]SHK27597.1 hypothetical protein SAMN05444342_1176 [Haladaptatus paucihalophilus DX253]
MALEIVFRVFVAGVLVVAPTLLFLGLWRGLMALRNDDLVNRTMNGEYGPIPESPIAAAMFGFGGGGRSRLTSSTHGGQVRCRQCDAVNPEYADYCGNCLDRLG